MAIEPFIINQNGRSYPLGNIVFGADYAGRDYVTPMARFTFYDNKGNPTTDTPTIYIKMPGQFNSTLINSWQESANIFGTPGSTGTVETLNVVGTTAMDALQAQFIRGVAGTTGAIASAGLGGRTQIEYLTRRFLNNFQQLIYQGPTFRRFQMPFQMRPTSDDEAIKMMAIVHTFRTASAPNAGITENDLGIVQAGIRNAGDANLSTRVENTDDPTSTINASAMAAGVEADDTIRSDLISSTDVLSFSYPDMCKFDIVLDMPGQGNEGSCVTVFESGMCVIETVAVDYGSQNKLQFFTKSSDGSYYPTDVNLSISLRETFLQTAGSIGDAYNKSGITIL